MFFKKSIIFLNTYVFIVAPRFLFLHLPKWCSNTVSSLFLIAFLGGFNVLLHIMLLCSLNLACLLKTYWGKKKNPCSSLPFDWVIFSWQSVVSFYTLRLASSGSPPRLLLQHRQEPEIPTRRRSNLHNRDSSRQVKFKSLLGKHSLHHTKMLLLIWNSFSMHGLHF